MGDSSARPCDSCEARRARWFCAADGAYLCHACDTSVHTANSVASRHDRVRLTRSAVPDGDLFPSWPRKRNRSQRRRDITTLPATTRPDLQQFLSSASDGDSFGFQVEDLNLPCFASPGSVHGGDDHSLNNDHPYLARTNLIEPEDSNGEQPFSWLFDRVKVEESDDGHGRFEAEAGPDGLFDLNIDFFHFTANTDDVKEENCYFNDEEKKICLTLNYEDVLSAWSDRGSPWADQNTQHDAIATERKTGIENVIVPELNLWRRSYGDQIEGVPVMAGNGVRNYKSCGGREARVKRYREKKRSRLFSKRIRYHVRKLNAEKRPRMKGRFVKTVGDVFSETKAMLIGH